MSIKSPPTPLQQRKDGQKLTKNEFAVERIEKEIGKDRDTKYAARWYDYSAQDDIAETADHISKHFIELCWRIVNRAN